MDHQVLFSSQVEEDTREAEALLSQVIPAALEAEGVEVSCLVEVLFTDDEGIRELNAEFRRVDKPTDVLSFPLLALAPGDKPTEEDMDFFDRRVVLGSMAIDLDRARAQGEEFGHGPVRETAYLAVHSLLHLLGYDHEDEGPMKAQMRRREEDILTQLGITKERET